MRIKVLVEPLDQQLLFQTFKPMLFRRSEAGGRAGHEFESYIRFEPGRNSSIGFHVVRIGLMNTPCSNLFQQKTRNGWPSRVFRKICRFVLEISSRETRAVVLPHGRAPANRQAALAN